ncbi:MAG TPA: hypothetical protein VF532_17370 [Candidatus Angelobacter sp.]
MDLTKLPPGLIGQIAGMVEDFILSSRKKYAERAAPLTPEQRAAVQPFFAAEILDQTRVLVLHGERVQDPPFYGMARMMGFKNLPSFADTTAVTFIDVIAFHEEITDDSLFHELVHVVQYQQLGTREFASRYLSGFVKSGSYEENPLEKHAYELEQRYSANRSQPFFVADEVRSWANSG